MSVCEAWYVLRMFLTSNVPFVCLVRAAHVVHLQWARISLGGQVHQGVHFVKMDGARPVRSRTDVRVLD